MMLLKGYYSFIFHWPYCGTHIRRTSSLGEAIYKLTTRVSVAEHERHVVLLMSYPLKALRISKQWAPLFRRLNAHTGRSLDDLCELGSGLDKQTVENFLDRLEKSGWVAKCGLTPQASPPDVTVIIPVRNRPEEIRSCLTSLGNIDYPNEKLQIIVVDDASDDDTAQAVENFPVTLHRMMERRGASACRNWGVNHARGEIVCFLDSDCAADSDWLHQLLPVFRNPRVGGAGGLVDSHDDTTALDRYEKVKSALNMGTHTTDSSMGNSFFYMPSCNLALRKEAFTAVGGFDEKLEVGEDVDLCWRMIDSGWILEYRPSARILHKHRNRILPFCRRRFEYGTSEPILQALHLNRIKTFVLWPKALGFWMILSAVFFTQNWAFGLAALLWILTDALLRRKRITRMGVSLNPLLALEAVIRCNLSFLYHCGSFLSRYYLMGATLILPVIPQVGIVIWCLHLMVGAVEFIVRKPKLNLTVFLGLFSLEQLSYQAGVWWGCFRSGTFLPVFPRISMKAVE